MKNCSTCEFWNREHSVNMHGEIIRGFVSSCKYPIFIPNTMPASVRSVAMNWDEGTGCSTWKKYNGVVKFFEYNDELL